MNSNYWMLSKCQEFLPHTLLKQLNFHSIKKKQWSLNSLGNLPVIHKNFSSSIACRYILHYTTYVYYHGASEKSQVLLFEVHTLRLLFFGLFGGRGCSWSMWRFPGYGLNQSYSRQATSQPQQHRIWARSVTYTIAHGNARFLTQGSNPQPHGY